MSTLIAATEVVSPITYEVIRNRFDAIVREMSEVTTRSARSSVISEGRDFSCGIFDSSGNLLAIGTSIPVHIFPIAVQVQLILKRYAGDIHEGDLFLANDPFQGGTHLNDVLVFVPIFVEGELFGVAANRAHWYDIGGAVPGSISGGSTAIFEEGLRIPPIRVGREYKLGEEFRDLIIANVRVPAETRGDLSAQIASCRIAAERVQSLCDKYGAGMIRAISGEMLDRAERRIRAKLEALPDGTKAHEGYLDNDGIEPHRRQLRVTVTVRGDSAVVDFTGSAEQSKGPLNVGETMALCFAFMGAKAALDPEGPINAGSFRPISVIAPKGTMLNAEWPAPMGGMGEVGQASIFAMIAFGLFTPDTVSAEDGAGANHQNLSGLDPRRPGRQPYIYYDYPGGGSGAVRGRDGLDFVRTLRSGNTNVQSVEVLERIFPIRFVRHELRRDSGGPGQWRGGLGVRREYIALAESTLSILSDHAFIPPSGLESGLSGATAKWTLIGETCSRPVSPVFGSKSKGTPVAAGEHVLIETQGGGGFGNPLDRAPEAVAADVIADKVSVHAAHDLYGVAMNEAGEVDREATQRRRAEIRGGVVSAALVSAGMPTRENGVRIARANPSLVERAGGEGFFELLAEQRPAPVRVWLIGDTAAAEAEVVVDEELSAMTEWASGQKVEVRRVSQGAVADWGNEK